MNNKFFGTYWQHFDTLMCGQCCRYFDVRKGQQCAICENCANEELRIKNEELKEMDKEELKQVFIDFLNMNCLWGEFEKYVTECGYTLEELEMEDN